MRLSPGETLFRVVDDNCPIRLIILGAVQVTYDDEPAGAHGGGGGQLAGPRVRTFRTNELLGTEHLLQKRPVRATAVVVGLDGAADLA